LVAPERRPVMRRRMRATVTLLPHDP
jgi:hypothetical protein